MRVFFLRMKKQQQEMSTLHENEENLDKRIKNVINDMNAHKKEITQVRTISIRFKFSCYIVNFF